MSKNFVQDIVKKRSLKEILPSRENSAKSRSLNSSEISQDSPTIVKKRSKAPMILLWVIGVLLIIFLFIILSTVFAQATIDIVPRQGRILLENEEFQAYKQAASGQLEFGLVSAELVEERTVPATGTEEVSRKASGQITIFNSFDENPQELIANTRFESPTGLIYRIDKPVVVPGMRTVDGQEVPGQVTATVYADQAGENYNIGLVDFTIPGFAGGPRFEGFFAKSETPMTGGFIGEVKTVSDADEESARVALRSQLESQDSSKLKPQVPEGFIMFPDATFTSFESEPITADDQSGSNEAVIKEKLVVTGILFDERELASFVASQFIPDYDGEPIEINNIESIEFELIDKSNINPNEASEISISLNGNAHMVWVVDEETLKDSVRGLGRDDFQNIISRFPAIEKITPKFRPPWIATIPDNLDKIKIEMSIAE